MNEEKEIWCTYPEFDFIQGSNFGRVRTIDRVVSVKGKGSRVLKGRILKQFIDKGGYLQVHFSVNGKKVNRSVHRIIAGTFLPNPDNQPELNHKDNDRTNNNVSNLEWCTHEYNIEYREKYGKAQNRPVFATRLKTLELFRFSSRGEASRELGVCPQNINKVLKGEHKQAGGYWFTEDKGNGIEIDKKKLREISSNTPFRGGIYAVNLKTQEVLRFKSQREASRVLRVNRANIARVVADECNQTDGYWFTKDDGHAVDTVKSKLHGIGGTGLKL